MATAQGIAIPARPGRLDRRSDRIGHQATPRPSIMVYTFIFSMMLPFHFQVGTLVIHSYRMALLAAAIPVTLHWLKGGAKSPDVLLICFVVWASLALALAHGTAAALQPAGVLAMETFVAYLLGRVYIRNSTDFVRVVKALVGVATLLLPIALYESLTSANLILDLLGMVANVHPDIDGGRLGLHRAQTAFQHPIHYGVFCAGIFGMALYLLPHTTTLAGRVVKTLPLTLGTFLSLSAGPLSALVAQAVLAGWDVMTKAVKRRWAILGGLFITAYVVIDLLSNRTPFHVFVSYLTFNSDSGYNRILIWHHGTAEVLRHPVFGIGLGDWERPIWMSSSMDNFWLVIAVQFGLPALVFFGTAVLLIMYRIGRAEHAEREQQACRTGLLISLGGLLIAGVTVHYWSAIYALLMFMLGSGMWLCGGGGRAVGNPACRERGRHLGGKPKVAETLGQGSRG